MSQYQGGKVSVTNKSAVVTGTGTGWTTSGIAVGNLFCANNSGVWYAIKSIDSDTQITLSSAYNGATAQGLSYAVQTSYTPNNNYPLPSFGDVGTAGLLQQTLLKIDAALAALSPVTAALEGQVTLNGAIQVSGNFPTIGDQSIQVGELFVDANGFLKVAKQVGGQ